MDLAYTVHDGLRRYAIPDDMLAEAAATRASPTTP